MRRRDPSAVEKLDLCRAVEQGKTFETGRPVTFRYVRSTEPSPTT